jgi:hypothetical protein
MPTSGNLAARAELYGPTGALITNSSNSTTGSVALTATGAYTILVRDLALNKTGGYALNLQFTTGRCATSIACDQNLSGAITGPGGVDAYKFSANSGEAVYVTAVSTSGALAARVELYSPAGALLAMNGSNNTTGARVLLATGAYTLLVRDLNLNRAGNYALNLQFTTGRCGRAISSGQLNTGNITNFAQVDSFTFFGRENGTASVTAVATSGGLVARAEVYSPAGVLVGTTGNLTLRTAGTYTILVRDLSFNKTGAYNVGLSCTGTSCNPALNSAPSSQRAETNSVLRR